MNNIQTLWNKRVAAIGTREKCIRRYWYKRAMKLVKSVELKPGMKALDLGCGAGDFTQMLADSGFEVEGCDGDEITANTISIVGAEIHILDLEQTPLPFNSRTYDLVACLEVIEHIGCAESLFGEIYRLLKPRGYLVISTPNFAWIPNRVAYLLGKGPVNEGVHIRFFTKISLLKLLKVNGFSVIAAASFTPIGIGMIFRLLKKGNSFYVNIPSLMESLLAWDFIWLARKM